MATKTINLKGKNLVLIDNLEGGYEFLDLINSVQVTGNQLTVNIAGGDIYKFTNIADPKNITIVAKAIGGAEIYNKKAQQFYEDLIALDKASYAGIPTKGVAVTGTVFDEIIDVSAYPVADTGKNKDKGLTINANDGNDTITGTSGNDTTNAGAGDDSIIGGNGNDAVTGGLGVNEITYTGTETGLDTIKLTKGESLTIDLSAFVADKQALSDMVAINGSNLEINFGNGLKTLKLNSFVTSNGVGADGHVFVNTQAGLVDLNEDNYIVNTNIVRGTITGTRFSETLSGEALLAPTNQKTNAGVTINAGLGDDSIVGSKYNDKLTGGKGVNTFVFDAGIENGVDTITDLKEDDVIQIKNVDIDDLVYNRVGKNLEIYFNDDFDNAKNNKIVIQNYFVKSPSVDVEIIDDYGDVIISENLTDIAPIIKGSGKVAGTAGDDFIYGDNSTKDTILAGDGDDDIFNSKQDDAITGGKGKNTIHYTIPDFGRDTITLTKDETLIIDLSLLGINKLAFDCSLEGKNLVIDTGVGEIVLKNYAASDITGPNGDVRVRFTDSETLEGDSIKDIAFPIEGYKGSWLNEEIDASQAERAVTIDGGAGDDNIIGSDFKDILKGGDGNDTIEGGLQDDKLTGGKGADTFLFVEGDGVDTITDADNLDHIYINGIDSAVAAQGLIYGKSGNNLEIYFDKQTYDTNRIIVQNYFTKNPTINLINDEGIEIANLAEVTYTLKGKGAIAGTDNSEYIDGSDTADVIKANGGNDTITGGLGDDKIYGVSGNNTIIFNEDDGTDTVFAGAGNDTVVLNSVYGLDDLENVTLSSDGVNLSIKYSEGGVVTIDNYYANRAENKNSVKTIQTQNGQTVALDTFVDTHKPVIEGSGLISGTEGADTISGSIKADTINALGGDDMIYATAGNDTITGGTGTNTIVYSADNFGTDTVILTEGEKLTLDLTAYNDIAFGEDVDEPNVTASRSGNSLVITTPHGKITLMDYMSSDITGQSGSVTLKVKNEEGVDSFDLKNETLVFETKTNFTGSWLNEEIDASAAPRGVLLEGVSGEDEIIGSNFADTITAGIGNTEISAGKGNDVIKLNANGNGSTVKYTWAEETELQNHGHDVIYNSSSKDTLYLNIGSPEMTTEFHQVNDKGVDSETGNDLKICFWEGHIDTNGKKPEGSITIKGYYAQPEDERLDNLTVYSTAQGDSEFHYGENVLSLKQVIAKYNQEGDEPSVIVVDGSEDETVINYYTQGEKTIDITQVVVRDHFYKSETDGKVRGYLEAEKDNNDLLIRYSTEPEANHSDEYPYDKVIRITNYYQNGKNADIKIKTNVYGNDNPVTMPLIDVAELDEDHRNEKYDAVLTIRGTFIRDYMHGSKGADIIYGEDGNDYINGESGSDIMYGGAGNDRFVGGAGNDSIYGGAGENIIVADSSRRQDETFDDDYYKALINDNKLEEAEAYYYQHTTNAGNDVIYSSDGTDTICIYESTNVSAAIVGNDLVFTLTPKYETNAEQLTSTLTVKDYVTLGANHSVKYVLTNWMGDDTLSGRVPIQDYVDDIMNTVDFVPNYECDEEPTANNTFVINPTSYMYVSAEGNDLVFTYWDEGADGNIVTRLENYFTTGSQYKYISVSGDEPVLLDEYTNIQIGTDANEIFTGTDDGDIIFAGEGNDKIYAVGGQGSPTNYVNPGAGRNRVFMSNEHWEETYILNGGGEDTIVFPEGAEISISTDEKGLLHLYYEGEVQLDEPDEYGDMTRHYDGCAIIDPHDTSVNYVQFGTAQPVALSEYLNTLRYDAGTTLSFEVGNKGNDLIIEAFDADGDYIDDSKVRLTNYFKGESLYEAIKIGNADAVSIDEMAHIQYGDNTANTMNGTTYTEDGATYGQDDILVARGGNDTITGGEGNDSLIAGTGDDTFVFGKHYHRDVIFSENTAGQTNTDTLVFQNHSLAAGSLDFGYSEDTEYGNNWDVICETQDLRIYGGHGGPSGDNDQFGGDVIYKDYFGRENGSWNTPSIVIQDANNDTYTIDRHAAAITEKWSDSTVNKVAFIFAETGISDIMGSATKSNFVYTDGGAGLNYTYKGGTDTVNSASYENTANDTYIISSFTTSTSLTISDGGGVSDSMSINADSDDIRLVYTDLYKYQDYNNEWHWSDNSWYGVKLVHVNNLTAENLGAYLTGEGDLNGIYINADQEIVEQDEYGQNVVMGKKFGIETLYTNDSANGLDIATWATVIASDVAAWLDENDCGSVQEAFEQDKADTNLLACYQSYDSAMAQYNANPEAYQLG